MGIEVVVSAFPSSVPGARWRYEENSEVHQAQRSGPTDRRVGDQRVPRDRRPEELREDLQRYPGVPVRFDDGLWWFVGLRRKRC
ncbi:hypothetical protein D3C86_1253290 [compost metagenome]